MGSSDRLEELLPVTMAVLAGSAAAIAVILVPAHLLATLPIAAAADPVLGMNGRGLLAAGAGIALSLSVFIALRMLKGVPAVAPLKDRTASGDSALYQGPERRRPISAADELGAPFQSVVAEPAPMIAPCETGQVAHSAPPEIQSLAELVARFEAGLQRRRANTVPARRPPIRLAPAPEMEHALREALGTLRRVSARANELRSH